MSKPREWFINPVVGYKCEVNEDGIGLTGNEVHVIEKSAYDQLAAKLEMALKVLEQFDHHPLAKDALDKIKSLGGGG